MPAQLRHILDIGSLALALCLGTLTTPAAAAVFTVTNTANSGAGSLEQAIQDANTAGGADSIHFNIPGPGPHTISPTSGITAIASSIRIDGTTDPSFSGTPVIELDGDSVAGTVDGLVLGANSDGSVVHNLIIKRFTRYGIYIQTGADSTTITGNWIGTDGSNTSSMGNQDNGIEVRAQDVTIGGTGPYDGNVINFNGNEGINLRASGARIVGNIIGLEPDGSSGSGNSDVGIAVLTGASNTTIGGPTAAERNVISRNYEGIEVNTSNNTIQGNYIGTDAGGTLNRGNDSDDGIEIQSSGSDNLIGGATPGEGNLIAFNLLRGVTVVSGTRNTILGNRIHSNGSLGIDLNNNGVTENDPGDVDGGSNNRLNFPEITAAVAVAGSLDVDFDLDVPAGNYRIEFFTNPSGVDPSGNGEGQLFAGATQVNHLGGGVEAFSARVGGAAGDSVTSTCTECATPACTTFENSSEFSDAFRASGADLALVKTVDEPTPGEGDTVAYTVVVTNHGPDTATNVDVTDLLPSGVTYVSDTPTQGSYNSGSGVWTVGSVANAAADTLTITATVDAGTATSTIVNTAAVTFLDQSDPDSANDSDDASLTVLPELFLVKRCYLPDGTPIPTGATLRAGQDIQFLIYVNNRGPARSDVSVEDVLDPTFVYQGPSIRLDNTVGECASDSCTGIEEAAIYASVSVAPTTTDVTDTDAASYHAGTRTVSVGDEGAANAQLDLAANQVWALLFNTTVQ